VALEGMLLIRSGRFVLQRHRLSAIDAVDGSSTGT
jgi:hypothetical protein